VGEFIKNLLPFPIPASIYGLLILLSLLCLKVIKVSQVKEVSIFLIEAMTLMFIPPSIGIMVSWDSMKSAFIPILLITFISTILIMGSTASIAQFLIRTFSKQSREELLKSELEDEVEE
jgi:lrgA family protein